MMLHYFVGEHLQDVLLLEHQFDFEKVEVLLMSVKIKDHRSTRKQKDMSGITLLPWRAFARCSAP
jgi:hypothetical protein